MRNSLKGKFVCLSAVLCADLVHYFSTALIKFIYVPIVRSLIWLLSSVTTLVQAQGAENYTGPRAAWLARKDALCDAKQAAHSVEVFGLRQPIALQASTTPQESTVLQGSTALSKRDLTSEQMSSYLKADVITHDQNSDVTLTGHAQVRRHDSVIKGDKIFYHYAQGWVDVMGHARLLRAGTLTTGPAMHYNLDTKRASFDSPNFWLGATNGFAQAERAEAFSHTTLRLNKVTYTGCDCEPPAWFLKSRLVDLDFEENEGVAHQGVLHFKGAPILASPYLSFPILAKRKSGLLLATYGMSNRSGFDLTVPYYLNIAPNYDLTLSPRYLTKRGVQLGAEQRYLGATYSGYVQGTYLHNDHQTAQDRWLYNLQHTQQFKGGFYGGWNVAGVSDDEYYQDFMGPGVDGTLTTFLLRQGELGWRSRYWQSNVQFSTYQTLQDPNAPLLPPYNKLPEFSLYGARYNWGGVDAEFAGTATRFLRPALQGVAQQAYLLNGGNHYGPNGDRLMIYPALRYPFVRPGWFITPKVGYHLTQYQNTNWFGEDPNFLGTTTGYSTNNARALPILSLDSGMIFERDTTLFGKASTQLLEPRLYFLYVPYRDQSRLPAYDTALADFSFAQAFDENVYVGGWDRIANAKQLTAALTTRWLDADSGFERLSLAFGQQIYFEKQRVTLPGMAPRQHGRSNFLAEAGVALTDTLSARVGGQYDPNRKAWQQGLASLSWAPQRLTAVSLAYRYQINPLKNTDVQDAQYLPQGQNQVSLAFQWPFSPHWFGVGRFDYSLYRGGMAGLGVPGSLAPDSRGITQAIIGLEYKGACCWTGRVLFQRYRVAAQSVNNGVFFQLELNGLGSLGTNLTQILSRNIPGYQSVSSSSVPETAFERYE